MTAGRETRSIEARLDGEDVVACALTVDALRLSDGDGGFVEVGGIGNVETHPGLRRRGHARALLEQVIREMRERGWSASLLYGIDHFYEQFGWRSCGDERWVRIPVGAWREQPGDGSGCVRAARAEDLSVLRERYESLAQRVPGAVSRRGTRAWDRFEPAGSLVVERDGAPCGWAWLGEGVHERDDAARQAPGALAFAELQAVDEGSMLALVDAACAAARAAGREEVLTGACEAHVLRRLARAGRIECRLVDDVRPHGGPMLLPFDAAGEALLAHGDLYQFLPDRF